MALLTKRIPRDRDEKNITIISVLCIFKRLFSINSIAGPVIGGASTGKIYQAGLSYGTNVMMLQATGKTTTEHMLDILNSNETNLLKKDKF